MNGKLYICNLPRSMTEGELTSLFTQAGEVILVDLIKDRFNGESKGFAFVTMGSRSEAERAILKFNAHIVKTHQMTVAMAEQAFQL